MENKEINEKAKDRLKRIEGQVRGLSKMIEDGRYCVDIVTQTAAVESALREVRLLIMKRHLNTCVKTALESSNKTSKQKKLDELMEIFSKFGK